MGENTYDIILAGRYMAGKEEVFKIVSGSNAAETVSRSKQSGLIKNWDVTMKQMYTTQGGGVVVSNEKEIAILVTLASCECVHVRVCVCA